LLAAAFVVLLLVALIDPAGTAASAGTAAGPSHPPQIGCPGDSPAPDASGGVNQVSCTR
jgi:hypothetical protein